MTYREYEHSDVSSAWRKLRFPEGEVAFGNPLADMDAVDSVVGQLGDHRTLVVEPLAVLVEIEVEVVKAIPPAMGWQVGRVDRNDVQNELRLHVGRGTRLFEVEVVGDCRAVSGGADENVRCPQPSENDDDQGKGIALEPGRFLKGGVLPRAFIDLRE